MGRTGVENLHRNLHSLFESRLVIRDLSFQKHHAGAKGFIRRYQPLQGLLKDPRAQNTVSPGAETAVCSRPRLHGWVVETATDAPPTPGRFLDIANKEDSHTELAESAWRHHWAAWTGRKLHR